MVWYLPIDPASTSALNPAATESRSAPAAIPITNRRLIDFPMLSSSSFSSGSNNDRTFPVHEGIGRPRSTTLDVRRDLASRSDLSRLPGRLRCSGKRSVIVSSPFQSGYPAHCPSTRVGDSDRKGHDRTGGFDRRFGSLDLARMGGVSRDWWALTALFCHLETSKGGTS